MKAIQNTMIINDIILKPSSVVINQPMNINISLFSSSIFDSPQTYTIELIFHSDNYQKRFSVIEFLKHALDHENLYALGNGKICKYCGHYNPAGKLKCHRCNGNLEVIEFVNPQKLHIHLAEVINSDVLYSLDEPITTHVSMSSPNPCDFMALISNKLYTLQSNFSMFPDYYMCAYCGTIIENDNDCPNCGGTRISLHEIIDIKRECLYCGNTTYGELVCNRCGAHLEAKILADSIKGV